jgi:hypothetical protein
MLPFVGCSSQVESNNTATRFNTFLGHSHFMLPLNGSMVVKKIV